VSDAPYPPPPPFPPSARPATNGVAVAALVLGIVALVAAPIPLVNFLGILLALLGVGLGVAGVIRGRRVGRHTGMAATGLGLSIVALAIASVVGFLTLRYLGDLLDFVDPPEPSAKVGERFTTDDGDLEITVTSISCAESPCTFAFEATNTSDRTIYLDHIRVKAVVDGEWRDPWLDGPSMLEPGQTAARTGTVGAVGHLDGLAFDADDASSHSAVVVDAGDASSGQ